MKKIVLAALIALLVLTGCGEKALDTDLNEDKNTVLSDEEIHNKEDGKITENTSVRSKPNLPKPVEPGLIHGNYFSKQQVIVDRDNPISVDSIPIKTVGAFADDDLLIDECAEEDDFFSAYGSEDGVELTVQLSKDYTKKLIIVDNEIYYASSVDVGTVRVIDKMTGELKGEYIFGDLNIEDMCVLDKCHFLCLACGDIYLADMESLTAKNLTNLGNVDFYSPSADKVTYFVTYGDNRSEETLSSNYEIMDIIAKEGRFIGNGTDSEVYYYLNRFIKNDGFEFYVRDEGIYRRGIIVKDYATNLNRLGDMLFYTPVNNKMMVKSINIYTGKTVYERRFAGLPIDQMYLINESTLFFLSKGELFITDLNEETIRCVKTQKTVDSFIPTKWGILYASNKTIYLNDEILNTDVDEYYVEDDVFVFYNSGFQKRRKLSEAGFPLIIPPSEPVFERPTEAEVKEKINARWEAFRDSLKIEVTDEFGSDFIVRMDDKYTYPFSFVSPKDTDNIKITYEASEKNTSDYLHYDIYVFDGEQKNMIGIFYISSFIQANNRLDIYSSFQLGRDGNSNVESTWYRKGSDYKDNKSQEVISHLKNYDPVNNTILVDIGIEKTNYQGATWAVRTDNIYEEYPVDENVVITVHPYWEIEIAYMDKEDFAEELDVIINNDINGITYDASFYLVIVDGVIKEIHAAGIC